jgi:hypothetical protein
MLTDAQQAQMDDLFARAGKPSAALQLRIDQLRAAKTEDEVINILFRDADVVGSKIEAELLCMVALAKQAELNPSINAKNLREEQERYAANREKLERLHAATATHFVIAEIRKAKTEAELVAIVDRMDFNVDSNAVMEAAYAQIVGIKKTEKPWWKKMFS